MELSQKERNYEQNHLDKTVKIIRKKISELGQEFYDKEEKYLYYVACTRCQHQLIVYNQ